MLSAVDDSKPQRMTSAIGAWISLPGSPRARARGMSPPPEGWMIDSTAEQLAKLKALLGS